MSLYWLPVITTLLLPLLGIELRGMAALGVIVVLALLNVSMSGDNAVANAKSLKNLLPRWQNMFYVAGLANLGCVQADFCLGGCFCGG